MKILLYISRIFVGALFIVSGLIKANDTLGFSYKLEEYFENGALAYRIRDWFGWDSFSLEFLMEHALMLAVIMCAAEIILGFAVLFGTKVKFATISLLALTTMFFFLTLHTATCDPHGSYDELTTVVMDSDEYARMLNRMENNSKLMIVDEDASERTILFKEEMPVQCVTDCGCFGDAILPQAWGQSGIISSAPTTGQSFSTNLNYTLPATYNENNIKLVGFVSKYTANHQGDEVLNAEETSLQTVGISKHVENKDFSVFPNPSNGFITIKADQNNTACTIFSSIGEIVYMDFLNGHNNNIDLSTLKNGLYFIKLNQGNYSSIQKIIINKNTP